MLVLATAAALALASVPALAGIVINEIDYDQPGLRNAPDTAEWLELYNPDPVPQSLDGYDLVLSQSLNMQPCTEYGRYALDGLTIPAEGYLVLGRNACAASDLGFPDNALPNTNSGALATGPAGVSIEDRASGVAADRVTYGYLAIFPDCGGTVTDAMDDGTTQDGSIQLCGSSWGFSDVMTPCAVNNCSVPTEPTTWGMLKGLYR